MSRSAAEVRADELAEAVQLALRAHDRREVADQTFADLRACLHNFYGARYLQPEPPAHDSFEVETFTDGAGGSYAVEVPSPQQQNGSACPDCGFWAVASDDRFAVDGSDVRVEYYRCRNGHYWVAPR